MPPSPPFADRLADALADRRVRGLLRLLLAAALVAVAVLALLPDPPRRIDTGWDKGNHLVAFAALAVNASLAFATARRRDAVVAIALVGYGGAIEVAQHFVPGRAAEGLDVAADAVGIAIGIAAVRLLRR